MELGMGLDFRGLMACEPAKSVQTSAQLSSVCFHSPSSHAPSSRILKQQTYTICLPLLFLILSAFRMSLVYFQKKKCSIPESPRQKKGAINLGIKNCLALQEPKQLAFSWLHVPPRTCIHVFEKYLTITLVNCLEFESLAQQRSRYVSHMPSILSFLLFSLTLIYKTLVSFGYQTNLYFCNKIFP